MHLGFGISYNRYHSPIWNPVDTKFRNFRNRANRTKISLDNFQKITKLLNSRYANHSTQPPKISGGKLTDIPGRNLRKFGYSSSSCPLYWKIPENINVLPFATSEEHLSSLKFVNSDFFLLKPFYLM